MSRPVVPSSTAAEDDVLDALGDGVRRTILRTLRAGPSSVGQLAQALPVSRPAVSQHLKVLADARLVTFERHGTRNLYTLDPAGIEPLRRWVDETWGLALERYAALARAVAEQPPQAPGSEH